MPLFFQHNINEYTQVVVWHIQELESFFQYKNKAPVHINHTHKKLQHIVGRFLLSYLIPDFPYNQLAIDNRGKPYLLNRQYHFSISHTDDYVAVIISEKNIVGIDIEKIQSRALKIVDKFLSKAEQKNLVIDNEGDVTLYWCIKEAIYKCYEHATLNFKDGIRILSLKKNNKNIADVMIKNKTITVSYQLFKNIILVWVLKD